MTPAQPDRATRRPGRHRETPLPQTGGELLTGCRPPTGDLVRLLLWTLVEAAPAAVSGLAVAHAVDGFRAHDNRLAALWMAAFAVAIAAGAVATRGLYAALAPAVEGTRDRLMTALIRGCLARIAGTDRPGAMPLTQLLDQLDQIRNLLSAIARNARTTVAPLIAALAGSFGLSPLLGLVVAAPVILALLLYALLLPRLVTAERAAAVADEQLGATATAVFENLATVTGLGAGAWAAGTLSDAARTAGRADLRVVRLHAWRHLVIALGGYAPLALVILVAPPLLANGRLSVGDIAGAATYVLTGLLPALSASVTGAGGWFVQLAVLLGRLLPIARTPDPSPVLVPTGPNAQAVVSARQLGFAYRPEARPVIDALDLTVESGRLVALVGPSGAGKTTLAHLITGMIPPSAGRVGAAPGVSTVLAAQRSYVVSGTVRENLCYLVPGPAGEPTGPQLWDAIDAVGLRAAVQRWGGLDGSPIADGRRPTPSEAQRLVLARCRLSDAEVLVLDEAWSLLDEDDRRRIEAWLRAGGRTLVVITHHLDVLGRADLVAYFDGRTVATGTHAELTESSTSYRDLTSFGSRVSAQAAAVPVG